MDRIEAEHRLAAVFELLSGKWSMPVLGALRDGTHRFQELASGIEGISRRMLSMTLRRLEQAGLVERHVYARIPARVEYDLSPLGETLVEALAPLDAWAHENLPAVRSAQDRYERHEAFRHAADAGSAPAA